MNNQRPYSSGLLYSIEPNDLPSLHLQDDNTKAELVWDESDSESLVQKIIHFITDSHL